MSVQVLRCFGAVERLLCRNGSEVWNVRGSVDKRASFHRERRAKWDRCGLVGWMRVGLW